MKREILFATALIVLLSACKKQSFEEQIMQDVKHFNEKEAPKQLDPVTTYDSIGYDTESHTLSYYYTIEGNFDQSAFPTDDVKQLLLDNLRSSIQYKQHKEHGLSFHYVYIYKETGEALIDCTFSKEDYR